MAGKGRSWLKIPCAGDGERHMHAPPPSIDGAKVVLWAWSGDQPFFVMPKAGGTGGIPIHGLAVCQYPTGEVYRFSCDKEWVVQNDSDWRSIEEAMTAPSAQYDITQVKWRHRQKIK